jgi:hypothetical protein
MAQFRWAYINCTASDGDGAAAGPTGSLQFISGSGGHTTGSYHLIFNTGSVAGNPANTLVLSGNMVITGTLSASVYNYQDITVIDATGSTFFGDTNDDRHYRTGSFVVSDAGVAPSDYSLSVSSSTKRVHVRGFSGRYRQINGDANIAVDDYIIGCSGSGNQVLNLPSASLVGPGALLIIKDEYNNRGFTNITISASSAGAGGFQVDDSSTYILTGTMPAINLYSNGTDWFVF